MAWSWRCEGPEGEVLVDPAGPDGVPVPPAFVTRSDAESWIGEHWRGLRKEGVARVLLLEDDVPVGRPLPLDVPDRPR